MKFQMLLIILLNLTIRFHAWSKASSKEDPNLNKDVGEQAFIDPKHVAVSLDDGKPCKEGENCPNRTALNGNFTQSNCELEGQQKNPACFIGPSASKEEEAGKESTETGQ
jgi:hypothetical protein